jgi:hypothetical protein
MIKLSMESVFPASRENLWRVLKLHVEDDVIGRIHPRILSQQQISKDRNLWVLQRKAHSFGRSFGLKMRVEMAPPEMYRWEIIASDGGVAPGSYVENKYSEAGEGTIVSTKVEMTLKGVPGLLQKWIIDRGLSGADQEDLQYLRKMQT